MICDFCGKEFPDSPDACVMGGLTAYTLPEKGDEWKGDLVPVDGLDDMPSAIASTLKSVFGLTDKQLAEIKNTGNLSDEDGIGLTVCQECRDNAEPLDEPGIDDIEGTE